MPPRGSGGLCVLIKDSLYNSFSVNIVDKHEGIFGIELKEKITNFTFVLYSCYLAPEGSIWGRDPSGYFGHLLAESYLHCNDDVFMLCGDFNSRIGADNDCLSSQDHVDPYMWVSKVMLAILVQA